MIFFLYHKTNLLIGIMNKNIIQIGSLCICILLLVGVLYVMKTNEGFQNAVAPTQDPELLTRAKQAVRAATDAVNAATRAVGTSTETSAAKEAHSKATDAVTAANTAVRNTMDALKKSIGLENVAGDPSLADINEKITAYDGFARNAKTTLDKAIDDKNRKDPAAKKKAWEDAVREEARTKTAWEALPN
jgi:hypothetical protein